MKSVCEICGEKVDPSTIRPICKQVAGQFKFFSVCKKCDQEHEKELEMVRANYRAQFGDDWH